MLNRKMTTVNDKYCHDGKGACDYCHSDPCQNWKIERGICAGCKQPFIDRCEHCDECPVCESSACTGCPTSEEYPFCIDRTTGKLTCKNHDEWLGNPHAVYYGHCAYCILCGCDWEEEWDSQSEFADRVLQVVKMGTWDATKGEIHTKADFSEENKWFFDAYFLGHSLALQCP